MSNHENYSSSTPDDNPQADLWRFDEIVGDPKNQVPISVETQNEILSDTLGRFREQWKDTGLYNRVMSEISADDMYGKLTLNLKWLSRKWSMDPKKPLIYFNIENTEDTLRSDGVIVKKTRNHEIRVATSGEATGDLDSLVPIKNSRFTQEDADLVGAQIKHLADMRDDKILPNLSRDYNTIYDPFENVLESKNELPYQF